jgi:hypothetical protein
MRLQQGDDILVDEGQGTIDLHKVLQDLVRIRYLRQAVNPCRKLLFEFDETGGVVVQGCHRLARW